MAVDPTGAALRRLREEDDGGPVVMLNLLRFKDGGKDGYLEYSRSAAPFLAEHGGTLLYAGDGSTALVAEDGQAWEAVLVVRYPSRDAFLGMISDPGYQRLTALRTEALSEAVLQATTPWFQG